MVTHLLTVDVEDYFHVTSFDNDISRERWDGMECRVEGNVRKCLALFHQYQARATFFILGWVAQRYPDLISEIARSGHEIASHGLLHEQVHCLGQEGFRASVRDSRKLLQDCSGQPVTGYRAPSFSLTGKTPWAWDILQEEGYLYDSSVYPVHHDRYGIPDAPREAHYRNTASERSGLLEIPLTTLHLFGLNLPVGGGGYLRIFPLALTRWGLNQAAREGRPGVVYLHPWELDPAQPRIKTRWTNRLRHYTGLSRMEKRLTRLLENYRFGPIRDFALEFSKGKNQA